MVVLRFYVYDMYLRFVAKTSLLKHETHAFGVSPPYVGSKSAEPRRDLGFSISVPDKHGPRNHVEDFRSTSSSLEASR